MVSTRCFFKQLTLLELESIEGEPEEHQQKLNTQLLFAYPAWMISVSFCELQD